MYRVIPVGFGDGWEERQILLDSLCPLLCFGHLLEINRRLLELNRLQQSLVLFVDLPADLLLMLARVSTLASDCSIFGQNRLQRLKIIMRRGLPQHLRATLSLR